MEISESHARELEKQAARKAELGERLRIDLANDSHILFEAGCGHGHWLNSYAEANPEQACVGVDLISWRIRKAEAKRDKRGLQSLHFYKAELGEFLDVLPSGIRFDATVLLFPDPWPKARHHRRRMVQKKFLDVVAARTDVGGRFYFRSDDRPYFDWTLEHLKEHPDWEIQSDAAWLYESETYFQSLMDTYYSVVAIRK